MDGQQYTALTERGNPSKRTPGFCLCADLTVVYVQDTAPHLPYFLRA